jgi:uncharacterized protein (DUF2384 family)
MEMLQSPVMKVQLRDLYTDEGLVDMMAVSSFTGIGVERLARSIDMTPAGLRKNPTTKRGQLFGHRLTRLLEELVRLMDDNRKDAMIWLRKPHPELEDAVPLDLLLEGAFEPVEYLVYKRTGMGAPA